MNVYEPQNIRNIALLGNAGSGKTMLGECLLFDSGAINRRGTIEEGNTLSDFHELEQERGSSIFSSPMFTEYNNFKINILDTPGYDDYIGETVAAIRVVDTGFIVINSQNGVEVGTDNVFSLSEKRNLPVFFIINKLDVENENFDGNVEDLKHKYGGSSTIMQYPLNPGSGFNTIIDLLSMKMLSYNQSGGKPEIKDIPDSEKSKAEALKNEFVESIAETEEDLMNKYLEDGALDDDSLKSGLKKAIIKRSIYPILCCSSKNNIGVDRLLELIQEIIPSPADCSPVIDKNGKEINCDISSPVSLIVFKMLSEAHLGDLIFFRIYSGKLINSTDLINEKKNSSERLNQIFVVNGKKRNEISSILAGDIGATVKLKNTNINDTLHSKGFDVDFVEIDYPKPKIRLAVVPKTKGEEEKVGMGLHNLKLEDPSLEVIHSQELRQIILNAQGELHLGVAKWRLEHRYKVEAEYIEPRVPYRETITKQVKGNYRHKKQSGGAGQFAEVHMMVEPWYEGLPDPTGLSVRGKDLYDLDWGGKLEFVNCIVGGVIDQRFMPAILKGVMEKMQEGPLTGSYVRDIRVVIYDGKMHSVDSNEAAFKTAGLMVFKENFIKADPKILEPIYNVKIKVPEDYVGDVMSDLPSRRGLILGIDSEGRYQIINARMPLAELDKYSTGLRSMTQGKATYFYEFAEYQVVPPIVQQLLMDTYKKQQAEE